MMLVAAAEVASVWQICSPSTYQVVPDASIATP
jgi:hypothetical protein